MKKKVIGPILCFVFIIAVVFGTLYVVDHRRMKNNEPVVFSTWGYDYAPPEINPDATITINEYDEAYNPDEEQSFVGEVIEETTSYMIVEPVFEKVDVYIAEKVRVEYGTDHHDYLYGVGRRVVIYYKGEPEEIKDGMKLIKSDDISTEGFREFKLEIKPSEEKVKKEIVERTPPTDSSGKRWTYGNSALYYYGVENVLITIKGWTMPLEKALEEGRITLNGILAKCNQDVADGVIEEMSYDDGGSQVYKYPDYTIVKYHTLDGNDDMYIGTPDIDIHVKDK